VNRGLRRTIRWASKIRRWRFCPHRAHQSATGFVFAAPREHWMAGGFRWSRPSPGQAARPGRRREITARKLLKGGRFGSRLRSLPRTDPATVAHNSGRLWGGGNAAKKWCARGRFVECGGEGIGRWGVMGLSISRHGASALRAAAVGWGEGAGVGAAWSGPQSRNKGAPH